MRIVVIGAGVGGLTAGERVVTDNLFKLQPGLTVRPVEGESKAGESKAGESKPEQSKPGAGAAAPSPSKP